MKKMPRKFSQGGEMQPKEQPKSAEAKKPEAKKPVDNMPDWAKRDLKEKEQDWKTKQGAERKALTGYKKGGSIKKFAEGDSVTLPSNETYRFNPDTYEKARRYIETGKKDDEQEKPKAKSSAAPKATPKKSEATAKGGKGGGAGATEPDVSYGRRDAPTLGSRGATRTESKESPKVKDNESDSDLSVEPRRYLSRGRNYSATGEMSPEAAKAVGTGMTLATLASVPGAVRGASRAIRLADIRASRAARQAENQADSIVSSGAARAAQNRAEAAAGARAEALRESTKNAEARAQEEAARQGQSRMQAEAAMARQRLSNSESAARSQATSAREEARRAAVKREIERNKQSARDLDEMRFADEGNPNFKRGGKVAKYAKGGGVESKGKTKGTVVKMAKGGSVKGWGISRGAKACKMV